MKLFAALFPLILIACKVEPNTKVDSTSKASDLKWDSAGKAIWTPATGLVISQTLQLFSDAGCAVPRGPSLTIGAVLNTFTFPASLGGALSYKITTVRDSDATESTCSETLACPTNYLPVANDTDYATGNFCVAKYEMKNVSGAAVPAPSGHPWGSLNLAAAKAACSAHGARYHLITNLEWMTVARNIENNPANWSTTATPFLNKGRTGNCANPPLAASNDDDPCFGNTAAPNCANRNHADFRSKRTFQLSGGEKLWDFAGNVFEMVDHAPTVNAVEGVYPGTQINATTGTNFVPALTNINYKSSNLAHTDALQNIGVLFAETATSSTFSRGGDSCGFAGIYSITILTAATASNLGFRCVYK